MWINKIKRPDLQEFAGLCSRTTANCNASQLEAVALRTIKYYQGDQSIRESLRGLQDLESRWYSSLANGSPDFSVYDSIDILPDLWACWVIYSNKYLKSICSEKSLWSRSIISDMTGVGRIADLGCGIGYTTATLATLFPSASVVATNLRTSPQFSVCKAVSLPNRFRLVEKIAEIGNADLVFASEYFEHFERPAEHLREVLTFAPSVFIGGEFF